MRQFHIVVFQLPFHRHGSYQIHLIDSFQLSQHGLDVFFRIALNQNRSSRRIQRIGHKRTFRIVIRTAGMNLRIAHSFRQLRPCLPNNGRHLETGGIHIGMLVHLQSDATATVVRCRVDTFHSLHTAEHSFQPTGHFCLNDPRRIAWHHERYRQSRQVT